VLHSDAKVPFTIKVIDSDEVNAFALPGGFFYVNKVFLLAADNEAELAGVMAQRLRHVCARHAVENQYQSFTARISRHWYLHLSRRNPGNDLPEHCESGTAWGFHEV